jgi:hypothetical protein
MSFEDTFDRIALALEKIAEALQPDVITAKDQLAAQTAVTVAALGAEAVTAAAPARKPRARPAKITAEEKAAATPAEVVSDKPVQAAAAQPVDDFLSETKPAAKPPTLEELRAALKAYSDKVNLASPGKGMEQARVLLGKFGNGALRLAIAKDVPGGDQGIIAPEYYQAVINAALA